MGESGGGGEGWKSMEYEMNRFEKELKEITSEPQPTMTSGSSMAATATTRRAFIPSQLRKPAPPPVSSLKNPVIISGAPQVYSGGNAPPKTTNKTQIATEASVDPSNLIKFVPSTTPSTIGPSVVPAESPGVSNVEPSSSKTTTLGAGSEKGKKIVVKKKKKSKKQQEQKPKKFLRAAGGTIWEDTTLLDWDPSGFRLFCGDLGNDVTDEVLTRVFGRYPSFQKAKVIRDKRTNKTKGYGFVSFKDPNDFVRAIKELDGRYVGSRPIKLRKSAWKNRNIDQVRKRDRERNQLIGLIGPKKPGNN